LFGNKKGKKFMKADEIKSPPPDLKKLMEELEAAKKQILRQEFKIEVLASRILQLSADQLAISSVRPVVKPSE
jgi:hypothetical protein